NYHVNRNAGTLVDESFAVHSPEKINLQTNVTGASETFNTTSPHKESLIRSSNVPETFGVSSTHTLNLNLVTGTNETFGVSSPHKERLIGNSTVNETFGVNSSHF